MSQSCENEGFEIISKKIMVPGHDVKIYSYYIRLALTQKNPDIPLFVIQKAMLDNSKIEGEINDFIDSSKKTPGILFLKKKVKKARLLNNPSPLESNNQQRVVLALVPMYTAKNPPTGIAHLKSFLEKNDVETIAIDLNIDLYAKIKNTELEYLFNERDLSFGDQKSFNELLKNPLINDIFDHWVCTIEKYQPDLLGISSPTIRNVFASIELAKRIKAKTPERTIVIGGPSVNTHLNIYEKTNNVDYLIKGEGEKSLLALTRRVNLRTDEREPINGLLVYENKKFIIESKEIYTKDLNEYGFADYSDFPHYHYKSRAIPITGSRGCIGNCSFCNIHSVWPGYRVRTAHSIHDEIKHQFKTLLTKDFLFYDSLVNGNIPILEELCELLIQSNLNIKWTGSFRVRKGLSPELFIKMKESGCIHLNLGIESGSEKVRKDMNKAFPSTELDQVLSWMQAAGLKIVTMMIIGYPTETEDDFQESLDFIKRNKKNISAVCWGQTCYVGPELSKKYNINFTCDSNKMKNWEYKGNDLKTRLKRVLRAVEFTESIGVKCVDRHYDTVKKDLEAIENNA